MCFKSRHGTNVMPKVLRFNFIANKHHSTASVHSEILKIFNVVTLACCTVIVVVVVIFSPSFSWAFSRFKIAFTSELKGKCIFIEIDFGRANVQQRHNHDDAEVVKNVVARTRALRPWVYLRARNTNIIVT